MLVAFVLLQLCSHCAGPHLFTLLQVSISGQAVVFVVRTMSYSLIARAGAWTYIAFFLAQVMRCVCVLVLRDCPVGYVA